MKFAIINDMHIGPADTGYFKGVQRKLVGESERLVTDFVRLMNEHEKPEFVVNLGDTIEDVNDREVDIKSFERAIELLKAVKMPLYCLVGNHDVRTLTHKEITELLDYDNMHYSFDHNAFHFVVLSFEMTGNHKVDVGDISAIVPPKQVEWLQKDLAATKLPTVVFIHYGLADDDMAGNFWFETMPEKAHIGNKHEVRQILEDSGRVKAVISAHQHWNRMFVHNGIPYFTVTSLVENFNNDGQASEAHTLVNLTQDKIELEVRGNDPASFQHSFS